MGEGTYGKISFESYLVLARKLRSRLELLAEVPLQPVGEADGLVLWLVWGAQPLQHLHKRHQSADQQLQKDLCTHWQGCNLLCTSQRKSMVKQN